MKVFWLKIPWLVPRRFLSWVPLPRTVISRKSRDQVSALHYWHEVYHCMQINRYGYFRCIMEYWRNLRVFGYDNHPAEMEARDYAWEMTHDSA